MLSKNEILQYLRRYKEENKQVYSINKLGIFGSFSRDEASSSSDIDIVVDFHKADIFNQISIKQELEKTFGTKVDIVALWKHMNPKLRSRIDRDALYV